jgi:hypothetical protein
MIKSLVLEEETVCRLERVKVTSRSPKLTDARKAEGKPENQQGYVPETGPRRDGERRGSTRRSWEAVGRETRAAIVNFRLGSGVVVMRQGVFVAQVGFR